MGQFQPFKRQPAADFERAKERPGPAPFLTLSAFADLGVSNEATARYFSIDPSTLKDLQREFGIKRAFSWRQLMPRLARPHTELYSTQRV